MSSASGGLRPPYLLPGSSPDPYLGFAPGPHGYFSPPDPFFCGVQKILYSGVCVFVDLDCRGAGAVGGVSAQEMGEKGGGDSQHATRSGAHEYVSNES